MAQPATQSASSGAIVKSSKDKLADLRSLFESKKGAIAAILPKHLSAERVAKLTISAISRNPELLACSKESIFFACIQASELGLEFGNVLGHAYLVPFNNKKTGRVEAQFIPGYRGLIALARRSGQILSIESHLVYERDRFTVRFGLDPKIDHEPCLDGDPGPVKLAYAVAVLRDGAKQAEVMTLAQLNAVRNRSAASSAGPWVTDTDEMYRKTVVKRLWKYLPMSTEMQRALEADTAHETGEPPDLSDLVSASDETEPPVVTSSTASLKDKLRDKAAEREPGAEG